MQANVDRSLEPSEWKLDALSAKLVQYCPLLEGLTANDLTSNSNVSYLTPDSHANRAHTIHG